jgi:hypothetical protein
MAIQVHFAKLNCLETDDATTDEPYLIWRNGGNDKRIWGPVSMRKGSIVDTDDFEILVGDSGIIMLLDEDWPSDDHLGAHTIRLDELHQGWHRATFIGDDAHYFLDYEVFEG